MMMRERRFTGIESVKRSQKIDSETPFGFRGCKRSKTPQRANKFHKGEDTKKVFYLNNNRTKGVTESLPGASLTGEDASR